jgi:hypothetical protein
VGCAFGNAASASAKSARGDCALSFIEHRKRSEQAFISVIEEEAIKVDRRARSRGAGGIGDRGSTGPAIVASRGPCWMKRCGSSGSPGRDPIHVGRRAVRKVRVDDRSGIVGGADRDGRESGRVSRGTEIGRNRRREQRRDGKQ